MEGSGGRGVRQTDKCCLHVRRSYLREGTEAEQAFTPAVYVAVRGHQWQTHYR